MEGCDRELAKVRGVASASKMILDQRNTLEVLLNQAREALQQEKAASQQANEYSQHLLSKIDEMHAEETARETSLKNALVDIEKSVVCDAPPLRDGLGAFEHALATNAAILDHIEAARRPHLPTLLVRRQQLFEMSGVDMAAEEASGEKEVQGWGATLAATLPTAT